MADTIQRIGSALGTAMTNVQSIPWFIYNQELTAGVYGQSILEELAKLIDYYKIYEHGTEFITEGSNNDYAPSDLRYKQCRGLIDKEARFLFGKTPDVWVDIPIPSKASDSTKQIVKDQQTILQNFVDLVLKENHFSNRIIKAAKDCFIGKRIVIFVDFNESGIKLSFHPSTEFLFETADDDVDVLTKVVTFYTTVNDSNKGLQRIYKKKYYIGTDFYCHVVEELYDGTGQLVETLVPDHKTLFTYIPAFVIINDGLSGDIQGVSEVDQLKDYEEYYSRLANADQDAERKGMNQVKYAIDMDPATTQNLSTAPGAFWDMSSDQSKDTQGTVGTLATDMSYTTALATTLDRIRTGMYSQIDMPDVTNEKMQGYLTSGKSLKAIYWGLIVRCDEKMKAWEPALNAMVRTIIEGAKLYPELCRRYFPEGASSLPDVTYNIHIDNQYPLPEDEAEEKQTDLAEIVAQTMSRKRYMKKWYRLTDDEVQSELDQIAQERQLLEDNFMPQTANTNVTSTNQQGNAQTGSSYNATGDQSDDSTPEGV